MRKSPATDHRQSGFTIVELMIATSVLSTILLLVTVMMISIGNLFYKGINQTRVQDSARSITDEMSAHLQLSNGFTTGTGSTTINSQPYNLTAYCIGATRYSFIVGAQIGSDTSKYQSPDVLWRDDSTDTADQVTGATGSCPPIDVSKAISHEPSGVGSELIAPNSRLTALSISSTSPYTITIGIAYGDSDLLCDNGTSNDCSSTSPSTHIWNPNAPAGQVLCKGTTGEQFCSTANLTVTVVQRLTGGS